MSFKWDVQYMVKQGPNWYNLTRTYKTKRKAVSFANLHDTNEEENSSLCERMTVRKEPIVKEVLIYSDSTSMVQKVAHSHTHVILHTYILRLHVIVFCISVGGNKGISESPPGLPQ